MGSQRELTLTEAELYNSLLDLSWSLPAIRYEDIEEFTGKRHEVGLRAALKSLESKGRALMGPEEVKGVLVYTITPIVRYGHAYGHPSDYYKDQATWQAAHKIEVIY